MSYIINNSRGNIVAIVPDGVTNTANTSLSLVGQSVINYGTAQNENFVYLLENFARELPPVNPILGQLWYNSNTDVISAYNSANSWTSLASITYTNAAIEAAKISPAFSGVPTAPTATTGTANTQIATTAFVSNSISNFSGNISNARLIGNSTAITAAYGTNTTQIATTEFVQLALSGGGTGNTTVSGNLSITGGVSVGSYVSATGNVAGGNILTNGFVSAAGIVTGSSVQGGTLVNAVTHTGTTVSVVGNITGNNITVGNNIAATTYTGITISMTGNIVGNNIISAANVSANAYNGNTISASGNITGRTIYANTIYATNIITSGSTTPFRLPNLTQAQIDELSPQNGDMVYNTTLNLPQVFQVDKWWNFTLSYYS